VDQYERCLVLIQQCKVELPPLDDLIMADIVVSATEGLSGQIWFGTFEGRIILWDGGEFRVLDFSGKDFKDIESLAFDRQRNILWALSLHFSQCDAVSDACPPKILQVGPDGSQMFHETEQFLVAGQSTCNPPAFTSIAVTPDGKVWVGMMFCHNLVSYNGKVWETVTSRTLPLSDTDWATVEQGGSCSLGGYIANVFATKDGRLLIANQAGYVLEAKAEVLR